MVKFNLNTIRVDNLKATGAYEKDTTRRELGQLYPLLSKGAPTRIFGADHRSLEAVLADLGSI